MEYTKSVTKLIKERISTRTYDGRALEDKDLEKLNAYLDKINKGVLDVTEHNGLNESTPDNKKRIPFRNMIYVGDGLTDVPCMKLVKMNGGHSIAVYSEDRSIADSLISQDRDDFVVKADYRENSDMEKTVHTILNQIDAVNKVFELHTKHTEI